MLHSRMASSPLCQTCPKRRATLCRHVSEDDLDSLHRVWRCVPAGYDLFYQGEPCDEVFNILDGWAFLYELLEDGRRQILHFALPGELLGFQLEAAAPSFGAQAINDVELCVIPRARLVDLAHRHAGLAFDLACMLSHEGLLAYDRLTSVGRKTAVERLATLLLELFHRVRRRAPAGSGDLLKIPLTQIHIADALGLTPVHTNRMLGLLRQQGVIDYGNGLFHILDARRLCAIAGQEPAAPGCAGAADGRRLLH